MKKIVSLVAFLLLILLIIGLPKAIENGDISMQTLAFILFIPHILVLLVNGFNSWILTGILAISYISSLVYLYSLTNPII